MENKDYYSPEEEQNTSNPYENYANNGNNENYGSSGHYESDPYAAYNATHNTTYNTSYNQQQYANLGGVMVDGQGRPLKNRFALKLTLSIILILCCCCTGSPIVLVLGIIALVFTCLANSSFKAGNPMQFRSRARVSTVLISVGGGIAIFLLIIYVVFFAYFNAILKASMGEELYDYMWTEEFWEEFYNELENMEDEDSWDGENFWDDEDNWNDPDYWEDILGSDIAMGSEDGDAYNPEIIENTLGDGSTPLAVGFNEFTWNGVSYSLPMDYSEFLKLGIGLVDFVETTEFPAGEYEVYELILENGYEGVVRIANNTDAALAANNCEVEYLYIYNPEAYYGVAGASIADANMTILGGLSLDCSYVEVENYLGTPTYIYKEIDETYGRFETYRWYYTGNDEYQMIQISFYNDNIYDISIDHYGY